MQNITQLTPFLSYYYPIWIASNLQSGQTPYFNPITFYPQFLPPIMQSALTKEAPSPQNTKKEDQKQLIKEIQENLNKSEEIKENNKNEKKSINNQMNKKQKNTTLAQIPRTKRPQTYETQKSYYMKQKIKGKMKCNYRILRKRNLDIGSNSIKSKLRTADTKVLKEDKKIYKKKHSIAKEEVKLVKNSKKPKQKTIKDFYDSVAQIPTTIIGNKLENLKIRQLSKK